MGSVLEGALPFFVFRYVLRFAICLQHILLFLSDFLHEMTRV